MTECSRGFALPLVLATLAILAAIAALISTRASALVQSAQERLEGQHAASEVHSTQQTLLYLLSTRVLSTGGLAAGRDFSPLPPEVDDEGRTLWPDGTEIRLDGTTYRGLGQTLFELRDDRGRLSVNFGPRELLERFLGNLGSPTDTPSLIARLQDFQDKDDLVRPNGAESSDYLSRDLPPPVGRRLLSPLELRSIQGWDDALADADDRELLDALTTTRQLTINVNSASRHLLELLPGVTPEGASRVMARRAERGFLDADEALMLMGATPQGEDSPISFTSLPSDSGILEVWSTKTGPSRILHYVLTPVDYDGRPWQIEFQALLPRRGEFEADPVTPEAEVFPDHPDSKPERN